MPSSWRPSPRQVRAVSRQLRRRPGASLGWGALATFVVLPVSVVVLAITIIGLLVVIPGVALGLPLLALFVGSSVAALVGTLILARSDQRENLILAAVLGVVIWCLRLARSSAPSRPSSPGLSGWARWCSPWPSGSAADGRSAAPPTPPPALPRPAPFRLSRRRPLSRRRGRRRSGSLPDQSPEGPFPLRLNQANRRGSTRRWAIRPGRPQQAQRTAAGASVASRTTRRTAATDPAEGDSHTRPRRGKRRGEYDAALPSLAPADRVSRASPAEPEASTQSAPPQARRRKSGAERTADTPPDQNDRDGRREAPRPPRGGPHRVSINCSPAAGAGRPERRPPLSTEPVTGLDPAA